MGYRPGRSLFFCVCLLLCCFFFFYPACDLEVPDMIGDDCGREWLDPAMLEEDDDEDEEASNPELLLDDREKGPGKLSSVNVRTKSSTHSSLPFHFLLLF